MTERELTGMDRINKIKAKLRQIALRFQILELKHECSLPVFYPDNLCPSCLNPP
jgi:hypothetical protein